jgi:mono/diheme cytochrome c family protein
MSPRRFRKLGGALAATAVVLAHTAWGQPTPGDFPADQVDKGSQLYADNCESCHGPRMNSPGGAIFDLRTFPPNERQRFLNAVSNGKGAMPPWRSLLSPEDIESLFAYVMVGEKR